MFVLGGINDGKSVTDMHYAFVVPSFAPHGMIKCEKCEKIQVVSYGMIGKTLFHVESLPQGPLPIYKGKE
jgi:hypothetical protein